MTGCPALVDTQLLWEGAALLWTAGFAVTRACLYLPYAVVVSALVSLGVRSKEEDGQCEFYEGDVVHVRKRPLHNEFKYPVRMAVISLEHPPGWFCRQAADHMTADEARQLAGTDGEVHLLTHPAAAGYIQNPISVYYCHSRASGRLARCIAEVTNTPWAERVTFAFDPAGQELPKAMHVSPLMDMQSSWHLQAPQPGAELKVVIRVSHPQLGQFFCAGLHCKRSTSSLPNEVAGLGTLWRYGFQPHRVAFWIYWQALVLLLRGLPFQKRPALAAVKAEAERKFRRLRAAQAPCCVWRGAQEWPWRDS